MSCCSKSRKRLEKKAGEKVAKYKDNVEHLGPKKQLMPTRNQRFVYPMYQRLHLKTTKVDDQGEQQDPGRMIQIRTIDSQ